MALIAMAVYSTVENQKDDCLMKTLRSLLDTVDFGRHRLMLSVNGFTDETQMTICYFGSIISKVIYNDSNIGTARAINKVWALRNPGEHVVKMDDDIVVDDYENWLNEMEEAVRRDSLIGQIGLKRKDCWERTDNPDPDYKSELIQLSHEPGEAWMVVEKANHIIGSCVLHSSDLIDKVGGLYQPSLYGYDDVIMSWRTQAAGFYSCFLPHVPINHIDVGQTPYQSWKEHHAGEQTKEVIELCHAIYKGEKSFYYPFENNI
jgi:GT2 family glycosyltransferase